MPKLTKYQMRNIAHEFMLELGIAKDYTELFYQWGSVFLYDPMLDLPEWETSELHRKIVELEQKHNVKVYAVTHDYIAMIGETYSYLCVSSYEEDVEHMFRRTKDPKVNLVYAYVENILDEKCSEFGYIAVKTVDGSLVRVG